MATPSGTVRDNILFGLPYEKSLYEKVLFCSALEEDLTNLANGDDTYIGERGTNLSGGQKQRVSIGIKMGIDFLKINVSLLFE